MKEKHKPFSTYPDKELKNIGTCCYCGNSGLEWKNNKETLNSWKVYEGDSIHICQQMREE